MFLAPDSAIWHFFIQNAKSAINLTVFIGFGDFGGKVEKMKIPLLKALCLIVIFVRGAPRDPSAEKPLFHWCFRTETKAFF